MFHIQLKNDISGKSGDLLMINDDGTCYISQSLPVNRQIKALEPMQFMREDAQTVAPPRHAYSKPRTAPVVRNAAQIQADRERILREAIRRNGPFSPADLIKQFYSGHVAATDRRATNVRDDLRLMHKAGLIERVSDSPLMYQAAK